MLPTHYDYPLVALSVFIAICAGYAALGLAERVSAARGNSKPAWIAGGACAMGTAIWSMHYVGMLAFQLPLPVHYNIPLVLLSMVAAVLASALALVLTSQQVFRYRHLLIGALVMGGGIATMHYIGMAAMRMHCTCSYNWRIVALSVVIAVVVSGVALAALRYKTGLAGAHKLAAAILLGIAISSMHYTGMAAAHFRPSSQPVDLSATVDVSWLGGMGIAIGTLFLLAVAMVTSIADKHFSAQALLLHSTEERYRVLFERSLAAIYRTTLEGKVIDMNQACVELLGYGAREEVLGKVIRNAHMGEDDQKTYIELLTQTKRLPTRELQIHSVDGSPIWVMATATLLEGKDGSPPEIQGMLLSIEELKHTVKELRSAKHAAESASLAKSQFLANMSHELRTPLNGVLGMTQMLMDSGLSDNQAEYVDIVKTSAESLLSVISQILEFSTTEMTAGIAGPQEFDLHKLIQAEISSAAVLADKKHLKLRYETAPEVAHRFCGEPRWMKQILAGLISNAIKFTVEGEVVVTAASRELTGATQVVNISVRDTGVGIAPGEQAAIFEPFYQVDNSNSRRFGGTGLGLSIVRNLAEAMEGQVSVESQLGKGSTFSLLMPLALAPDKLPLNNLIAPAQETALRV